MIPNLFRRKAVTALAVGGALSIAAIACGTDSDGAPADGGNGADGNIGDPTPPPSSQQSGYDAVRQALTADGAVVANAGGEQSGIFDNPVINTLVNGEQVDIYEFATASDADAAAITVSADGSIITSGDGPPIAIDFLNPPHYFKQGNVIVVYTGGDGDVINLLRDNLGDEFAGDTSPVDPSDDPGYRTVVEPAPIESVEVIEDPDNPGFFLLRVTSGLPSGCATFHDITVNQTGELELTLTVLNRVPAPDEPIACTAIYGIIENTVPLGSAAGNLDVCEVYTVRWQSYGEEESLRFQVTAPNVRCANPDEPVDGPIVNPIISDLDALLIGLLAAGVDVEMSGDQGGKVFGVPSQVLTVNGERVDVYSFGPGDGALKAASGVSLTGFEIRTTDDVIVNFSWISTPHFYLAGNSIVLYVGVNEDVVAALDAGAGPKFAGPGATPIEPSDPQPLPGGPDEVEVPAPIVKVGGVVIAESFPPQYFVEITSAQPSGCDHDAGATVRFGGNDVLVTVLNTQPADLSVVLCLAVYNETTHNVRLGSAEFVSGEVYNLIVNGENHGSFTAQ